MADKIYVNGLIIKSKETSFGQVLKVSIKAADFGKFVNENKNENGWVNIDVLERKEVADNGQTHYAVLDTWKPNADRGNGGGKSEKPAGKKPTSKATPKDDFGGDDDIPF